MTKSQLRRKLDNSVSTDINTVSDITFGHITLVESVLKAIVSAGPDNLVADKCIVALDADVSIDGLGNMTLAITPDAPEIEDTGSGWPNARRI